MKKILRLAWPVVMGRRSYQSKVLNTQRANLCAFWPFDELTGTAAQDLSGNGITGTYTSVTLGQSGIGDGKTSALFNGTASYMQLAAGPLAALGALLDGAEITLAGWFRAANAGVWTDGIQRRAMYFGFGTETNDHCYLRKQTGVNTFRCGRAGTTTPHKAVDATISTTEWYHAAMTAGMAAQELKFYIDGAQTGITETPLLAIVGSLAAVLIGAASGAFFWSGYIAKPAVWKSVLTPGEILNLAAV